MTRAPGRKRIGGTVPRTENVGDLITAVHKVLSEGCESKDKHQYAVVVQDLATQWIQYYPCKTKTSYETERSLQKFLEPNRKPKVVYSDNSLDFGKSCEEINRGIIVLQHPIDPRRMAQMKERHEEEKQDVCCIIAIWLG